MTPLILLRIDREALRHTRHPRHLHPALDLKYIQARMNLLRLTAEERGAWNTVLEKRRAIGMQNLKSWKLPWKACPSCEGAFTGSKK